MAKMKIRAYRAQHKMSQQQLADALETSVSSVKNWEGGKCFPKQPMIEKICALFNVSYDEIDFSA